MQNQQRPEEVAAANLRAYRTVRGLSQRAFAERMDQAGFGWTQSTVAKTEAAARPMRVDELVAVADLLGVTVNQLLTAYTDRDRGEAMDRVLTLHNEVSELAQRRADLAERLEDLEGQLMGVTSDLNRARGELEAAEANYSMLIGSVDRGEHPEEG